MKPAKPAHIDRMLAGIQAAFGERERPKEPLPTCISAVNGMGAGAAIFATAASL